jgi:predicted GIY-YIG superfamily endonuclease
MAFIRKRANGMLSLDFCWKGKRYIKALGTTNENEAKKVKKAVEDQLARIRRGHATRSSASKREAEIKAMARLEKESLIRRAAQRTR